jgi:hypothetical protein
MDPHPFELTLTLPAWAPGHLAGLPDRMPSPEQRMALILDLARLKSEAVALFQAFQESARLVYNARRG